MIQYVDRRQVRRSFARAAADYGRHDFLAREIDRRMLERLACVRLTPKLIVDVGCARGASLSALSRRYGGALAVGFDLVPEMLAANAASVWQRWLPFLGERGPLFSVAEATALPLKAASAGLVWSNLLLHWLDDPVPALAEAHRVLEEGGLVMFSTFGPDTLQELRSAFSDGYPHTQRFADMHDLGDMLVGCGFSDPVMEMEKVTLTYDSLAVLLDELRASGGCCAMRDRRRGLLGKSAWQAMCAAYRKLEKNGKLPVSFEVIYGHAWKTAPKKTPDGRAIVRFDRLSRK